jgi:threonine dehydrogenase-like Zn-dependent dehydrogenase
MKAAAWSDPNTIAFEDRPEPEPGLGQVLVRLAACGVCGTDLHLFKGEFQAAKGITPGHEITGIVEGGEGFAPGTAVAVDPMLSCLSCENCRGAQSPVCQRSKLMGISAHGGLQPRFVVPAANCYALPAGIDPVLGSLAEPLAVVVRGIQRAEIPMGARVLVLGAGTIGLATAMLLRDRVAEVAVTARYPHQKAMALKLGASAVFDPGSADLKAWSRARRPDTVIETVGGTADTLAEAFRTVRAGGTIMALGVFAGHTQINGFRLVNDEITLLSSVMYGRAGSNSEFGIGVAELARFKAELPAFHTATFPLSRSQEAFETAGDKSKGTLKVAIVAEG